MKHNIAWYLKLAILAQLPILLFVASYALMEHRGNRDRAAASALVPTRVLAESTNAEAISGKPVQITVSSVTIDLSVAEGVYNQITGEWTLSSDKAHFATISSLANNKTGNTFIYGHNSSKVFQRLADVKVGDTAQIFTDSGYVLTYKYRQSVDVSPQDTTIFSYQGPAILTLQTCSGLWDQMRQLLTFDFVKAEKL